MEIYTEYARVVYRVTSQGVPYVHIEDNPMEIVNGVRVPPFPVHPRCRCVSAIERGE